jgi:hypothetical protein
VLGTLLLAGFIWGPFRGERPGAESLARVPAALSEYCEQRATPEETTRASATLSCQDPGGQEVVISLFGTRSGMDEAYAKVVQEAGVPHGSGDCATTTGAEHRYPPVGAQTGRVVCYRHDTRTFIVWTDDTARTVAGAIRRDGNDAELYRFWAALAGIPSFPTPAERELWDIADEKECHRAPAGRLDQAIGVVAAVECEPDDRGADLVTFYRFADLDGLRRSYRTHVDAVAAPTGGPACEDGAAPGFLVDNSWNRGSVTLGRVLCHPGSPGELVMEWTVESLLVMGRAVGTDPRELGKWWSADSGPTTDTILAAVNAGAGFPDPAEQALLDHIPPATRVQCTRASEKLKSYDLLDPGSPVAAVVCVPPDGAGQVLYYQFPSADLMAENYRENVFPGPDCASGPPDFTGEAAYTRGTVTGRLGCATGDSGSPYLVWTHDQLNILAFAYYGEEPAALLSWWNAEAGPV